MAQAYPIVFSSDEICGDMIAIVRVSSVCVTNNEGVFLEIFLKRHRQLIALSELENWTGRMLVPISARYAPIDQNPIF
jgi:hypothetical protein